MPLSLPFDLQYRLIRLFLDPKSRLALRSVCRGLRRAVDASYPAPGTTASFRLNPRLDRVAAAPAIRRLPHLLLPGPARLFYTLHPDVVLADIVELVFHPDRILQVDDADLKTLSKHFEHWRAWVSKETRTKVSRRMFDALLEATCYPSFAKARVYYREVVGPYVEGDDDIVRQEETLIRKSTPKRRFLLIRDTTHQQQ